MFLIHPSDLEQRRKRCRDEANRLLRLQREHVVSCSVCSSQRHSLVCVTDRYGLPLRMALCLDCGLFYLVDRFSAAGYSDFYSSGAYRTVSSQFNGVTHAIHDVQANQLAYARNLVRLLAGFVPPRREGKLLDVGGSTGIVARELAKEFGMRGTVLDPATEEVAAARAAGLDAVVGSLEDWNTGDKFDLIVLCRSIEHLFDLRRSLARIRSLLTPQGLFYCDIADFMEMCRLSGPPETFTKVDHCYWLTQSTALQIFRALGFELVSMNIAFGAAQVGFLLRACEPSVEALAAQSQTLAQAEEIQRIEREWRAYGATSLGPKDWLRRKGYRLKRRILRLARLHERVPAPKRIPVGTVQDAPKTT
jgi:SAM-dependent methyltransferase